MPSSREVFVRSLCRLSREPKVPMLCHVAARAQGQEVPERIIPKLASFDLMVDLQSFQ